VHLDLSTSPPLPVDQHLVAHGRRGLDDLQTVLAFEALLDDVHVQQPEEPAAEAEAQRLGVHGLVGEAASLR
jgi:hypothetical protein